MMEKSPGIWVMEWHHRLSQITGSMAMRIAKKLLTRTQMDQWIEVLEKLLKEMQDVREKL